MHRPSTNQVLIIALVHHGLSMREIMLIRVHMFIDICSMRWMNDRNHCVRYIRIDILLCWRDLRWGNLSWRCLCWTILRW